MSASKNKNPVRASNVYLFKNGYGMIVKTFEFPSNKNNPNQPVELVDPPLNPVHGTFWIQSLSKRTIVGSIRTKLTQRFDDKECRTVEDLVEANVGENVELLIKGGSSSDTSAWQSGKIISVKRGVQAFDDEHTDEGTITSDINVYSAAVTTAHSTVVASDLVLFQTTDHGLLALSLNSIQSIRGPSLKITYPRKVSKKCLSIDYKNESESSDVGLMKYLTSGITWAPSYSLVILPSEDPSVKRLRLSSKAVILNDIENMSVDHLFCIVGFPNTSKFASVIDPMMSGADANEFLNKLQEVEAWNTGSRHHYNGSIMQNSVMSQQMISPSFGSGNYGPTDHQQDTDNNDLHLYQFDGVLLQKKERLMLPIFDIELPYKDVYHCKIASGHSGHAYARHNNDKDEFEEVWHSVEFENTSNFVWTTAPIVITKGEQEQQFIGQDKLTYTLKGSSTFVNLTKALDIRVQLEEKVTNANPSRFILFSVNYQTDTIEGKVTIMNFKSEEAVVVLNTTMMGKITNYSLAPKKDHIKADENVANPTHDIRWEVNIKPKQKLEIKYVRTYNKRI